MSGTLELMRLLVVVLAIASFLALGAGLSLLLAPKRVIKILGLRGKHPKSVRSSTKSLERPRDSDKVLMRYPSALGVALIASGAFVLYQGSVFIEATSVALGGEMLARFFADTSWSPAVWESMWVTLLVVLLLGAALAILVGVLAFVKASKLKQLSAFMNRWVSTRRAAKPAAQPYYGLDRLVAARPEAWGVIIALLSIYTLAMIIWFGRGLF